MYRLDYLEDVRLQFVRPELVMTQVQFDEIDEFLESMIVDLDDTVPSQNQFLDDYPGKGRDARQMIVLERDHLRRYIQPLLLLEMQLQTPVTAVHEAV